MLSQLTTVLDTALNALASGAYAAGAIEVPNVNGADLYGGALLYADFELYIPSFQVGAPVAGTTLDLYVIPSYDGTNYVDGSDTVVPQSALKLGSFAVRAVATAQRMALLGVRLPVCAKMKFVLYNGTSRQLAATLNTLKMMPYLRG